VIELIERILRRGVATGEMRHNIDPVDVHMLISSFCFFRVANRHTFEAIFSRDPLDAAARLHYRTMLGDLITGYVAADSS
jgi:hypothetical protein